MKKQNHFNYTPCYKTHAGLKIGEYTVYGGNCATPAVHDADIYVGLDPSFSTFLLPMCAFGREDRSCERIYYYIRDMSVPGDPNEFKSLIDYLIKNIRAGKKVHIGCIGGHGRTGIVLAALANVLGGIEDAITYVRENYCEKAVETAEQGRFLNRHFGIKEVQFFKKSMFAGDYYGGYGSYKGTNTGGSKSATDTSSAEGIYTPDAYADICFWSIDK
jgi:hypothetical protein